MDQRHESIVSPIPLCGPDDVTENIDAIIVSVYYEYTKIAPCLRKAQRTKLLSITEIAD